MLMKIWTTTLLFLAWLSFCAWLVLVCHEKNIHPLRDFCAFFKKQSKVGRVLLGTFFIALWVIASTKPGGEIQGLQGQAQFNPDLHPVNQPLGGGATLNLSGCEPISSTNTTSMLTTEDFERGFVMTRIGTDEELDFTPPPNATIVNDWMAFGAATDWIYAAFTNWTFKVATNDVSRLRIYSFGKVDPLIREVNMSPEQSEHCEAMSLEGCAIATNYWFAPFVASLGIVPQANWSLLNESDRPSQVWCAITPEGSLFITWQNALLDRDTDKPISFQIEFKTDGQFIYRYDLSRLDDDSVTNILAGASFGGNTWATNSLPTNVTSMAFYSLSETDAYDQDPDNDGLLTIDELFFYNTDPRNADTDYDGLNDGEELLVYGTDPLNPHSVSADYLDGVAAKLGELNPFDCPEGSTNTVLEHIFYSSTTNGVIVYPQSSVDSAVLEVSVSGTGTGRLVVDDSVVPLVAHPPMRSGAITNTLLLAVGRGVRKTVWLEKPDGLDVAMRSSDLMIGSLPTWYWPRGWIAFPHKEATEPCIHDFYSKGRVVSLVHGEEFPGLTATWSSEAQGVAITNVPPVSAEIHGSFPKSQERSISYTISHPDYICGVTNYEQTLRFCPKHVDKPANGSGGGSDDEKPEYWSCDCAWSGNCNCCSGEWCHCSCWNCPCNVNQSPTLGDDDSDAEEAYTNIVNGTQSALADVFYLYRANTKAKHLAVPGGTPVECCPCPDHRHTNYVAKVAYTSRVAVDYSDGSGEFKVSHVPCAVTLSGVSPSRDFGDSTVVFVTNGVEHSRHDCTVLGVRFESDYSRQPLSEYNQRSSSFGYPITVCTNIGEAATIVLRTDVLLTNGVVRLSMLNATGGFQVWLPEWWDNNADYHAPELLLSSVDRTERYFSIRQWRGIMQRYGWYNGPRTLAVKVLSSSQGHCDLKFEYAASNGTGRIHDHAQQRVTSVNPPLLPDYNHDGRIDAADRAYFIAWLPYRFWTNQDTCKGDDVLSSSGSALNCDDEVVNGTLDLVNFFPVSIDTEPFLTYWSNSSVTFSIGFDYYDTVRLKGCFVNCPWSNVGSLQTNTTTTVDNHPLSAAPLTRIGSPIAISSEVISGFDSQSGVLFAEAVMPTFRNIVLRVMCDGEEYFKVRLPTHIIPVRQMYDWHNYRAASGGAVSRATESVGSLNHPYGLENAKKFIFLHGANVSEENAEKWGDAIFKRLWHAGCHVEFHNIDWRSDMGGPANYQQNAFNAFAVASVIATDLNTMSGEKVIMAHSLGNMVVSSMIQDHGLQVGKYMMCDSAVSAEAYDTSLSPTNLIVHPAWNEYPRRSFANEWYRLFLDNPSDDRRKLTWEGRFPMVRDVAVNFYSQKDHVLELFPTNAIGVTDGYENWDQMLERYSWQKQELWKGRKGILARMGTTDWSGWSIRTDWLGNAVVDPSNALHMAESVLKTNTVFKMQPLSMNTNSIPRIVLDAHLAQGIPARTPATGLINICNEQMLGENFNLNSTDDEEGIPRPNGWPTRTLGWLFTTTWTDEWLHSDMKDVSYFYTYKFYEKVKQKGELP